MRICVFGAGAIGGYMAGELALAGHEVCAIARGAHLAAIRSHGLRLVVEGQTRTVDLAASDDPAAFGPQDVVICALKAQHFSAVAGRASTSVCRVNNVSGCLLRWPEEADVDGDFLLDGDRKCNRCYPSSELEEESR